MSPLCILNVTNSDPAHGIQPTKLSIGSPTTTIRNPKQIPSDGPLILYIVGHAVPNGLLTDPSNTVVKEEDFAKAIQARRGDDLKASPLTNPTLIVWDVCSAKSFLDNYWTSWPPNYVHIFSSQAYERSWHTGANAKPPRQSLFSSELNTAVAAWQAGKDKSWVALEARLRDQFGILQTPEISPKSGGPDPSAFFGQVGQSAA